MHIVDDADVVDRHDVGMGQFGQGSSLTHQALRGAEG
jgi:hypothetical protein